MPRWFYYLLILAVFAPIISLIWGTQQEMVIFICSALSLIPLAALIGRTTEDLEYYVGPTAGGLLNATFGNAPELIIGIFALRDGLISVVKASLTGSVISNVLLVLAGALALGQAVFQQPRRRPVFGYAGAGSGWLCDSILRQPGFEGPGTHTSHQHWHRCYHARRLCALSGAAYLSFTLETPQSDAAHSRETGNCSAANDQRYGERARG